MSASLLDLAGQGRPDGLLHAGASIPAMPSDLPMTLSPLPYERLLEERPRGDIDLVVIHCTELPDLQTARRFGEEVRYDSGTGNSGHYYIDRDGSVHQYVRMERIAHHVRGYNPRSVGIELVNVGRYPDWLAAGSQQMNEPYTEAQIESLIALIHHLQSELPSLVNIAGHEDLDRELVTSDDEGMVSVHRKLDPGPLFPWHVVTKHISLKRILDPDASHSID